MPYTLKALEFLALGVFLLNIAKVGSSKEIVEYEEYAMPNSSPRKILYCPVVECKYMAIHKLKCCLCNGLPDWEYHNRSIGELDVILDTKNSSRGEVINKGPAENLYKLQFNNHLLTAFPDKICNFKTLVIMELQNNLISEIGNVFCLDILDTLILSGNQIREVRANSFKHNQNLRILDLSNNMLVTMDPGVLPPLALSTLILHHNYFKSYDITNLGFMSRPFCMIDISYNRLFEDTITNKLNLTLRNIKKGGQGFVDFQHNQLRIVPNFVEKISMKHLWEASRLWDYAIDVRNNPILCDCKLVPIMEMVRPLLKLTSVFEEFLDIPCFEPPNLRDRTIYNITLTGDWKEMNCPLMPRDDCPDSCKCYYKLSGKRVNFLRAEKRVTVNCTDSELHELPQKVPNGSEYHLFLSRNLISEISPRSYLKLTKILNLSQNKLVEIKYSAAKLMENISKIILTKNSEIIKFPENLKLLNPCRFKFPPVHLVCTCDNIWVKDWLEKSQSHLGKSKCNIDRFYCKTKSEVILLKDFDVDSLLCNKYSDKTEEIERVVLKCQNYIVVLSDEYFGEGTIWTSFEWKSIWKRFLATPTVNLIIMNFDLLERGELPNRPMKALLNLGFAVEFHNQDGDIHEKINQKLDKATIRERSGVQIRN
ncbi:hypothetical protein FSP39_006195 [Pinctada imbricata]|uniref:Uncharacterized protein n=1 Tax=Pinctada imbricata TaxID=66713 RepID=A0AA89C6Q5_PINIB|nr:hypothetical protein FSP39_006195 [Pinctada imbricata]